MADVAQDVGRWESDMRVALIRRNSIYARIEAVADKLETFARALRDEPSQVSYSHVIVQANVEALLADYVATTVEIDKADRRLRGADRADIADALLAKFGKNK